MNNTPHICPPVKYRQRLNRLNRIEKMVAVTIAEMNLLLHMDFQDDIILTQLTDNWTSALRKTAHDLVLEIMQTQALADIEVNVERTLHEREADPNRSEAL